MSPYARIGWLILLVAGCLLVCSDVSVGLVRAAETVTNTSLDLFFRTTGLRFVGIVLLGYSLLSLLSFIAVIKRNRFSISIGIVVSTFFFLLLKDAVNIPINDDYTTLLDFINRYVDAPNTGVRFGMLTGFYWESRLVITRCLLLFEYTLLSHVDIKILIVSANLCLVSIALLLLRSIENDEGRLKIGFIVILLLFNPGYYDATFWANDAIHYQFSLLFALITFRFALKDGTGNRIIAATAAVISGLSFGNGLLVFPIVTLLVLLKKNYRYSLLWFVGGLVFIFLYMKDSPSKDMLSFHTPSAYFIYSCLFLGNIFQFNYQYALPFIAGIMMWGAVVWLMYKRSYEQYSLIAGTMLYCVASSLVAAHFRLRFGVEEALSNRYGIFSVLALSCILIGFYNSSCKRSVYYRIVPLALLFYCCTGFFYYPEVPVRKEKLTLFLKDHVNHRPFKSVAPILPQNADSIMTVSESKGLFIPY